MAKENTSDSPRTKPRRGGAALDEVKPKRGLNKLPGYLREDLGWPDWLASSVVVIGGGLAMTLFLWILIIAFPAK